MSIGTVKRHSANPALGTITANGNTGTDGTALKNLSDLDKPRVVVALLNFANAPTGTTPSLTPTLLASLDALVWYPIQAGVAQTTSGQQRLVGTNVIEPFVQVAWVVTGTTPSFTGVTIDILFN